MAQPPQFDYPGDFTADLRSVKWILRGRSPAIGKGAAESSAMAGFRDAESNVGCSLKRRFSAMRLLSTAISTSVAVALLAGCSGNASSPSSTMPSAVGLAGLHGNPISAIPQKYMPVRIKPMRGKRAAITLTKKGIYVSALFGSHLYGFPKNNSGNEEPFCSVPATGVNDFGVDDSGNLIVPEGSNGIIVWKGPTMCGKYCGPQRSPIRTVNRRRFRRQRAHRKHCRRQIFSAPAAPRAAFRSARWPAERARPT